MSDDLIDLEVVSTCLLTPTVKEFVLKRVDGQPYRFTAGQHLMVVHEAGRREFSIASSPRAPETIRLAVRTVGVVTAWLHEQARGDVIQVTKPIGLEFHPKLLAGRELWLIAGGIGLTGLVATILEIEAEGGGGRHRASTDARHKLFYGLADRSELLWPDELERWRSFLQIDITGDGRHLIGDLLHEKLAISDNVTALVCGSPEFSEAVFPVLQKIGMTRKQILTNIWE